MSMFGWVLNKSKIWPKMVILPHPRYGDFYRFCLYFNSALKRPYRENEERSLHQIWSVSYWSPMSMFGWVLNKSKIWPKMVILPHPRYGDFYRFCLYFNSALKWPYRENEERSLHQIWSVCYWSPMSMFGWVLNKSKIWPKMVILPHPRYGDFYRFCLYFNSANYNGCIVRTKRDLFTKPNLVSVLLKPHVNVWLSFKQIQNLTQNGDFAPPAVWRFLPILPVF